MHLLTRLLQGKSSQLSRDMKRDSYMLEQFWLCARSPFNSHFETCIFIDKENYKIAYGLLTTEHLTSNSLRK